MKGTLRHPPLQQTFPCKALIWQQFEVQPEQPGFGMAFAGAQLVLVTFCRHTAGAGLRAPRPTMRWEPSRATLLSGTVCLGISSSPLFCSCHKIIPKATTLEGQLAADETATNKLLFGFCHSNMEQHAWETMLNGPGIYLSF